MTKVTDSEASTDGNYILHLNGYEAKALLELFKKLQGTGYNTGDWFSDIPRKLTEVTSTEPATDGSANSKPSRELAPSPTGVDNLDTLKEKLAAIEHERWSDWQKYCHSVLRNAPILKLSQEDILVRWDRQINTPYEKLSDKEKASDMEQVGRYWPLIETYVNQIVSKELEGIKNGDFYSGNHEDDLYEIDNYIEDRIAFYESKVKK